MQGAVDLRVYDAGGRLVRVLFGGVAERGTQAVTWDGRDERGRQVGSGVYVCRLRSAGRQASRKLLVVR